MTDMVPFRVPVALLGYSDAIGFGWSFVWQTSTSTSFGWAKYVELAYRIASIDKKLKRKYCNLGFRACIFGRDIVKKANTGWQASARSQTVLNILLSFSLNFELE
jgi:hypothetical protein